MVPGGSPSPAIRILVAEARPVLADRIDVLSAEYSDLLLVGAWSTGKSAIAAATRANPDVVLIGTPLPDADSIGVCEDVHQQVPRAAIILVADRQSDQAMLAAVEAGVSGMISPMASDDDVVVSILRAADGEFLLPGSLVQRLFRISRDLRRANDHCSGRTQTDA